MAEVYSYNVGFGNACLVVKKLQVGGSSVAVLVDAGSIHPGKSDITEIVIHIQSKIFEVLAEGGFLIVVITHPHADHYNLMSVIFGCLD